MVLVTFFLFCLTVREEFANSNERKFRVIQPEDRASDCILSSQNESEICWRNLKKKGLLISFFSFFVFLFVFFFHFLESKAESVGKSEWTERNSRKFSLSSFSWRQYYCLVLKLSRELWDMVFLPWFALQIHQVLRFNTFYSFMWIWLNFWEFSLDLMLISVTVFSLPWNFMFV